MYSVGGTLSGLASGASVVLQDSGGNNTTVSANGSFTFSTQLANNAAYAVTVLKQPTGQTCAVTSGSGSVSGANVTSIGVACDPATVSVIHDFDVNPDGIGPAANVVQGSDGNFYGTTQRGGTSNLGTVFKITPAGVETVLYSFADNETDGSYPSALIQGSDGNFYGTASDGGSKHEGTVFRVTPAGVETVLYSFGGGTTDGGSPIAALILGSDGNFYGTTSGGGASGGGTVFKITPAGVETVLHSFAGNNTDGNIPYAALALGSDGNFYGTTSSGGRYSWGTVFKVTPTGSETVLYSFDCGNTDDGCIPHAALIPGSDGNLYGTTSSGGPTGAGTVFKITPAGVETALHFFTFGNIFTGGSSTDGDTPNAALILGSDGYFYGTTSFGGTGDSGSLFKINLTGTETVVYSFNTGSEGQRPLGLIQGGDGNFYGTTRDGGTSNLGTVFEITSTGVETVLHSFVGGATDGGFPAATLTRGSDGNFYGTTLYGGTNGHGTVFEITPAGVETVLYSFAGNNTDGNLPNTLIPGSDGNFYGTTSGGGSKDEGTVFRITPAGVETVLYSFSGGTTDGGDPRAALIQGSDGNLYGTTSDGGTNGFGTVFRITPAGVETVLHSFTGSPTDGRIPSGGALVLGSDGNFYGTTSFGGTGDYGTVFKITPGGAETVLYSFAGGTADGSGPNTGLIQGNDGNFYGTTDTGGIGGDARANCSVSPASFGCPGNGTLFRITPAAVETMLYAFPAGTDGNASGPGALILGADGKLYGTTLTGGSANLGTVYKF